MQKILFLIFVFSFNGYCTVDEVIEFRKGITAVIDSNRIEDIFHLANKVDDISGRLVHFKSELIAKIERGALSPQWVEWFKRKFRYCEKISHKAFAAAIFYPYELVETSQKYHINQMNCAFKACIHYSAQFDPEEGVGAVIERGLRAGNFSEIKEDPILLKNLDILFPFNDSAFTRRAKEYLSLGDNLGRLHAHLMEKGTPTQLLNFRRLLKDIKRDDPADSALGKAYSNSAGQAEEERFLDFLDITFVANNGAFVEKVKAYLGEDDNLGRLYGRVMREGTATQLFNFAMILKSMRKLSEAFPCFGNAASKGSQRAQLELAYHEIESGAEVVGRLPALAHYGLWKIAQCFRYGKKVERDLRQANDFYLASLGGIREFPEIAYDVGDFVEELAIAQKDEERFKATSRKAIEYFRTAGDLHLGAGYIRAAQLMVKARERCTDLSTEFNDGEIFGLASLAAQKGAYTKATTFLKRIGQDPSSLLTPSTIGVDKLIKDINKKFGE